jgi:predicted aldo/keto reductase-like oxidoreductase
MRYTKMGTLNWDVSVLGFGCMRLPTIKKDNKEVINEAEASEMIKYAINNGINYFDTAWPYHEEQSEVFLGKVLKDSYHEKIKLATKCPVWLIEQTEDFDRYLDIQLKRLQTDYLDIYLFHG